MSDKWRWCIGALAALGLTGCVSNSMLISTYVDTNSAGRLQIELFPKLVGINGQIKQYMVQLPKECKITLLADQVSARDVNFDRQDDLLVRLEQAGGNARYLILLYDVKAKYFVYGGMIEFAELENRSVAGEVRLLAGKKAAENLSEISEYRWRGSKLELIGSEKKTPGK